MSVVKFATISGILELSFILVKFGFSQIFGWLQLPIRIIQVTGDCGNFFGISLPFCFSIFGSTSILYLPFVEAFLEPFVEEENETI